MKHVVAALACFGLLASAVAQPAARNWSTTAVRNGEGVFVIGNPAAPVKMIEYLSFTCNHCADYMAAAMPVLKAGDLRSGRVSIEVHHAIRDVLDLTAAMLARCDGPGRYSARAEAIFAAQGRWLPRGAAFIEAQGAALQAKPRGEAMLAIAKGTGLDAIVAAHGLPAARLGPCLANVREQELLGGMAAEAWQTLNIPGTPYFVVNGVAVSGNSWPSLAPRLKAGR